MRIFRGPSSRKKGNTNKRTHDDIEERTQENIKEGIQGNVVESDADVYVIYFFILRVTSE